MSRMPLSQIAESLRAVPFGRADAIRMLYRINPGGDYGNIDRDEAFTILRVMLDDIESDAGFAPGTFTFPTL